MDFSDLRKDCSRAGRSEKSLARGLVFFPSRENRDRLRNRLRNPSAASGEWCVAHLAP